MKTMHKSIITGGLAAATVWIGSLFAAAGPNGGTYEVPEINYDLVAATDAEAVWRANCAGCHGRDGKGQTRVGRRAGVKDLTDNEYQRAFSNERAFVHIREGMVRDGEELMKPFGEGLADDDGLSNEEVMALVKYLRAFDPQG